MGQCNIRFAKKDDIDRIMKFIDIYWKKNHILATDRELFEWQYVHYNKVTMVIGEDINGAIQGILGYVPYNNTDSKDIALALWKANHTESFLGIRLLMYLKKEEHYDNIICPGINMRTTSKIYSSMGLKVDTMKQWYRLNNRDEYLIGEIYDRTIPYVQDKNCYSLQSIDNNVNLVDDFDFCEIDYTPHKSKEYFIKRYIDHPKYKYNVFAVMDFYQKIIAWLVLRIQESNNSRIYRFVDFIGNQNILYEITNLIDAEMKIANVEYIDMYEAGLSDEMLIGAGWKNVEESGNIMPNYFAPFERCNVAIHYCTSNYDAIIFRGDGDQDRPN